MRDHGDDLAPECADETMRDALPALDHGRLPGAERRALEAHLANCAACAAELALLRGARSALLDRAPALDLERLAAAVIAGTRGPAAGPDVAPLAPRLERAAGAPPAWATRWASRRALRAAAAVLAVALGAGALTARFDGPTATTAGRPSPTTVVAAGPTRDSSSDAEPATPAAPPSAPESGGHVLGDDFEDLDDRELSAVLDAIERDGASLPALEPVVLAPEYVGGDG